MIKNTDEASEYEMHRMQDIQEVVDEKDTVRSIGTQDGEYRVVKLLDVWKPGDEKKFEDIGFDVNMITTSDLKREVDGKTFERKSVSIRLTDKGWDFMQDGGEE